MTDSAKRLRAWADPVEQGYEVPAAGQAMRDGADEIERLRAVVERQRNALKSILSEVLYGGTDFNDEPDIDRIHDFAIVGLREDAPVTANNAANTSDAETYKTD